MANQRDPPTPGRSGRQVPPRSDSPAPTRDKAPVAGCSINLPEALGQIFQMRPVRRGAVMAPDQARPKTWSGAAMPARRNRRRRRTREGRGQRHHAGRFVRLDARQHRLRLQRHPRAFGAMALAPATIKRGDGGMQMEMLVGVDVIQRQARWPRKPRTGPRSRRPAARAPMAGRTSPRRPAPCRCGKCRRHRPDRAPARPAAPACLPPAPDAGRRAAPASPWRAPPRRPRRARHHQAGGGQNAVAMGALDRLVDFDGGAEIIGGDDQLPQIRKRSCLRGSQELEELHALAQAAHQHVARRQHLPTISTILEGRK